MDVEQISRDTRSPVRQVEEILDRCINNGKYEFYARQENGGIKFDIDSPMFVRADVSGAMRGWAEKYD